MRMPPTGCAGAAEKAEAVGHRRRPVVANNTRAAAMEGMVSGEQYTYGATWRERNWGAAEMPA